MIKKMIAALGLLSLIATADLSAVQLQKDTITTYTKEIVITGMRYPEKIMEVPMAVSVINQEKLMNLRGYGMDDILNSIPGVLVQSRFGNQDVRITIRGYGARGAGDRSNSGTSRGIKILLDGMPETEPDGRTSFDNIDLSLARNIEIVRSNSSAVWGNAAGGVINISSVPLFAKPYVNYGVMGGSFGFQKHTLTAGSNIGSGKVYSSFSATKFDGWRQNGESERYMGNIGLLSPMDDKSMLGVYVMGSSNLFYIPGPLTQEQYDNDPEQANTDYKNRRERRYNRVGRIGVTFERAFNDNHSIYAMAFVNPKFLQRSERNTYRDFTRYHTGGAFNYLYKTKFSETIENHLLTGFDEQYQDGAILFYELSPTGGRTANLKTNKSEGANTFGAYAQNEIVFNDKFSVILGGRYDNVTYNTQDFLAENAKETRSFEHFTPKAGISWRIENNQSVYFNFGGGVEVPAGNETDPVPTNGADTVYMINPLLDPIVSTTYEIGYKHFIENANGFLRGLNYDVAAYYINTTNDIIPYKGGRFYFSAGETQRLGLELGLEADFAYGLSFRTAFTYSANTFVDYKIDSVHYGVPGAIADYKDNKIPGIPDMYYSASVRWSPNFLPAGIYAEAGLQGVGKYFSDDANQYDVPAYTVINLSLGMSKPLFITDGFNIKAFASVNNITDEKYVSSVFINPDIEKTSKLPMYLEPGLPRNFILGVNIGWN